MGRSAAVLSCLLSSNLLPSSARRSCQKLVKTYDFIVVGSGISGMTSALLLAQSGRSVLILEKAAAMGGSLIRFHRNGIPFDTGFHFTGGFGENGLLTKMLNKLGLGGLINPIFLSEDCLQRIVFESTGTSYEVPGGIGAVREQFTRYFPEEKTAIDQYFDTLTQVYRSSAELIFQEGRRSSAEVLCPEDNVSLMSVLDTLTTNPELKALLSIYCMCYGTKPEEVSFAAHSRVCYSLFESLARVEHGGDAFIRAFRARFKELDVEVRCNTHIARCGQIDGKTVRTLHLNTGEEIAFGSAVLTVHPREILRVLPSEFLRPTFVRRVNEFEESAGFFTIFATLDPPEDCSDSMITSLLPSSDLNALLTPCVRERDSSLVIVRSRENVRNRIVHTLTAFEPSFPEETARWVESTTGRRPADYHAFKAARAARILERIFRACPEYRGCLQLLDSASLLTYRDWLNSPTGAAYGIKQKCRQMNLVGRLPVANLFAAGQSAILPGVVGSMMSAFVVCRSLLGVSSYHQPACN
jgi:all-trans-retinol 13,14-reductase